MPLSPGQEAAAAAASAASAASQSIAQSPSQSASQSGSQSVVSGIDIISRSRFYRSLRSNAPHKAASSASALARHRLSSSWTWQIIVLKEQFIGLLFAF